MIPPVDGSRVRLDKVCDSGSIACRYGSKETGDRFDVGLFRPLSFVDGMETARDALAAWILLEEARPIPSVQRKHACQGVHT